MSNISGIGGRRHFSPEEEEALRRDESTSNIVKRDARTKVDISGLDRTWTETKHHQQGPAHDKVGAVEVGVTTFEGAEIAGVIAMIEHAAGKAGPGAAAAAEGAAAGAGALAPVVGLWAGVYGLGEAHLKGDEQARALAQDNAHVALVGALDLPASYKNERFEGAYKHVARGPSSPAFRATEALMQDKQGLATLQLHADRGMNAARDLTRSGMTVEAFLKANPKVAESYAKDAAFREGFDAYLHAKAKLPAAELKAFEAKLEERDGWYAQSQVQFRV